MKRATQLAAMGGILCTAGVAALAPDGPVYDLSWYTIDAGGGTSTGGDYELSGTIGQHDAGGPLVGGDFELNGGFWIAPAIPVSEVICPDDPDSFAKFFGGPVTGDALDLCLADDVRLEVVQRAQVSPLLPHVRLDYWANAAPGEGGCSVTRLDFDIEAHVSAFVGGGQNPNTLRTYVKNFNTGFFELQDQRGTIPNGDELIEFSFNASACDYIDASDGEIRIRQEVFPPGNVFSPNWFLKVDLFEVTVSR